MGELETLATENGTELNLTAVAGAFPTAESFDMNFNPAGTRLSTVSSSHVPE
jgi:hypothetical protein